MRWPPIFLPASTLKRSLQKLSPLPVSGQAPGGLSDSLVTTYRFPSPIRNMTRQRRQKQIRLTPKHQGKKTRDLHQDNLTLPPREKPATGTSPMFLTPSSPDRLVRWSCVQTLRSSNRPLGTFLQTLGSAISLMECMDSFRMVELDAGLLEKR